MSGKWIALLLVAVAVVCREASLRYTQASAEASLQVDLPTASGPSKKTADPGTIAALIDDLGSPDARRRDEAGAALMEMGPDSYAYLREAFVGTRIYEMRRRIRQVVLELYLTEHLGPPRAFLGISHLGVSVTETGDARVPSWGTALSVTDVFKASSAQRAGMQSGDLVVALNGASGTHERQAIEFTRWIGEQTPGTLCRVTLLRGGKGIKLVEDGKSGFARNLLAEARAQEVTHEDDPRVWPGNGAVRLQSVRGVPIEVDVRDGDMILALDDEPLPERGAAERFEAWRSGTWSGKGTPKKTRALQPGAIGRVVPGANPNDAAGETMRSIHLIRGGEGIDLNVTLGRWPTYLGDQAQGAPRAANQGERDRIIESFGSWWRETFDPEGTFSERADLDPAWDLRPGRTRS